jgi:amino-acid N-acetyltransferase
MTSGAMIRPAEPTDLPAVLELLAAAALPADGVAAAFDHFVVAELAGAVAGAAGVELYGDAALLRSVVVESRMRRAGVGMLLVEAALDVARRAGAQEVYLLTTTAEGWFPRLGFRVGTRAEVPERVQQSVEFREACPASAVVMVRGV